MEDREAEARHFAQSLPRSAGYLFYDDQGIPERYLTAYDVARLTPRSDYEWRAVGCRTYEDWKPLGKLPTNDLQRQEALSHCREIEIRKCEAAAARLGGPKRAPRRRTKSIARRRRTKSIGRRRSQSKSMRVTRTRK